MASAQPEPSMEEILASIRRIISEDEPDADPAAEAEGEADEQPPAAFVRTEPALSRGSAPSFLNPGQAADLAVPKRPQAPPPSRSTSEPSFPESAPAAGHPQARPGQATSPRPVGTDRPTFAEASSPASRQPPAALPAQRFSAGSEPVMPGPAPAATPAPAPKSVPAASSGAARDERSLRQGEPAPSRPVVPGDTLLGADVANVAGDAFKSLARSIRISSEGEKTLEDIVTDLLRPLVKEWLDQHLATIVEEKVQDEVERIARRGR